MIYLHVIHGQAVIGVIHRMTDQSNTCRMKYVIRLSKRGGSHLTASSSQFTLFHNEFRLHKAGFSTMYSCSARHYEVTVGGWVSHALRNVCTQNGIVECIEIHGHRVQALVVVPNLQSL